MLCYTSKALQNTLSLCTTCNAYPRHFLWSHMLKHHPDWKVFTLFPAINVFHAFWHLNASKEGVMAFINLKVYYHIAHMNTFLFTSQERSKLFCKLTSSPRSQVENGSTKRCHICCVTLWSCFVHWGRSQGVLICVKLWGSARRSRIGSPFLGEGRERRERKLEAGSKIYTCKRLLLFARGAVLI